MIEAWFNEYGFKVTSSKGDSKFIYDLIPEVANNASSLYTSRWMVLNHLLEIIKELRETIEDQDLALYTDSRLIEELQGDITPDSQYARASLQYFIKNDYVKFRRVYFNKCPSSTISNKLGELLNTKRPLTASADG